MRSLSIVLVAGVLLAPVLWAQGPQPRVEATPRGPAPGRGWAPMAAGPRQAMFAPHVLLDRRERLGLSDDQVTQLETLRAEIQAARERAEADAKPHQDRIRELWSADQPDADALQVEMRALMEAHQAAGITATGAIAKAKGLLTPEQRGRVEGWADARRMGARQGGRGPRWNAGPPQGDRYRGQPPVPPMRRF